MDASRDTFYGFNVFNGELDTEAFLCQHDAAWLYKFGDNVGCKMCGRVITNAS